MVGPLEHPASARKTARPWLPTGLACALLACPAALAPAPAQASDLFEIRLTLLDTGETGSSGFSSVEELEQEFENEFASTLEAYTETSIAEAEVSFRGVPFTLAFPTSGTALRLQVPDCGIDETFVGSDRDESVSQFEDFFDGNSQSLLDCAAATAAASTPVDPVAGNPNSLMGRMAAADFDLGFNAETVPAAPDGGAPDVGQLGLQFGSFSSGEFDGNQYTIPLRYTFNLNSGHGVVLDAPFNILSVSGAQAYSGSLGVGLRTPMAETWTVTPTVRVGAIGSDEFAATSMVYSGTLSSLASFDVGGYAIDLGNMVGIYRTGQLSAGQFDTDYSLTNFLSRHGIRATTDLPFEIFGRSPSAQAGVIRTDFFGDELFIDGYTDLIATIGLPGEIGGVPLERFRLGLTYTIGDRDYDQIRIGGAFRF